MKHAAYAAGIIVTLVVGLVAGSAITQARLESFIESELDRVDAAEESVAPRKQTEATSTVWVEPEEYDRAMGR